MLESESIMRSRGTGPALVLQHGFTSCLEDWYECGYVAALQPKYRLILVDARGHGDSDKPHDEASYTLDRRVADVTAVLDAATIEKARFWGLLDGWLDRLRHGEICASKGQCLGYRRPASVCA
jgi:pimeloyl-ACP methyl ester carboxylesterase